MLPAAFAPLLSSSEVVQFTDLINSYLLGASAACRLRYDGYAFDILQANWVSPHPVEN